MKLLAIGSTFLAILLIAGDALASSIALTSDQEACDNAIPEGQASIVSASRNGGVITLEVIAELNCAHVPDQPELIAWVNTATVTLPTRSPSGAAAMCLCAHKLTFEIGDLYEGVKTIYYVQDGVVLGHTNAP